ncbi:9925_t:CDS:2 [Racocetra persica]|uniref:9925_t:CDS:1 n=1 Tax=Racocetra persica TaxID=160502 RepID=A0ACA9QBP5_9GLOM|nr:9925_t:CDS:2 [Racocetra persica]
MKVENLSESIDVKENRNNRVQVLEYHQKSADEKILVVQDADITNKDEKEIFKKNSEHIEYKE